MSLKTDVLALSGRVDRIDDRGAASWSSSTTRPAVEPDRRRRPRLAAARPLCRGGVEDVPPQCVRVELHHLPSGAVAAHEHTGESLKRKIEEAESIARDARQAEEDYAELGVDSGRFPATVGPLCQWCDFRAHCPAGQAVRSGEVRLGGPRAAGGVVGAPRFV